MAGDERDRGGCRWKRALECERGPDYWSAVGEVLTGPASRHEGEFPGAAERRPTELDRRSFMKLMGASAALAGLASCSPPDARILPYADQPPEVTPGVALWYATSMVLDGFATGLLVRSNEGRPTKVEGNPRHPASLGATDVFGQASVLQLYDPDRFGGVTHNGRPSTWSALDSAIRPAGDGSGFRVLMHPQSGPHMAAIIDSLKARHPKLKFCFYSPAADTSAYQAAVDLFGKPLDPQFDFSRADVVLALDADFAANTPYCVRWARELGARRHIASPAGEMNRFYAVEAMPNSTSTVADHRLRRRARDVVRVAAAVLAEVVAQGAPQRIPDGLTGGLARVEVDDEARKWAKAVAADLRSAAGRSAVIAGRRQSPETHALAYLINTALGNVGHTTWYTKPALLDPGLDYPLSALVEEMSSGAVDSLLILEANPSYTAPADYEFSRLLRRLPRSACLTRYANETAADCQWAAPALHYLESWGDARAYDGTVSFVQPLIRPLYSGRTPAEMLAAVAGDARPNGHVLLRDYWQRKLQAGRQFDTMWETALKHGLLPNTAAKPVAVSVQAAGVTKLIERLGTPPAAGMELNFQISPALYDGRFANNPWLQELPHPIGKITWDNAAIMSPRTAASIDVDTGNYVELHYRGRSLRAPALVVPGHAEEAVTIELGYGRKGAETVARGAGVDAYRLRTSDAPNFGNGLRIAKAGGDYTFAMTQRAWTLHDRPIAYLSTLEQYRRAPEALTLEEKGPVPTMLPIYKFRPGYQQWAMTIDTSMCTGCSACVMACRAENNVLVVGRDQVRTGRDMHWLRIDTYYAGGTVAHPRVINQPMLCQHCEDAPCEYVCPVNATVHSPDGLNEMIYNRCVGTRFCANNCPYKVRRFNWFEYEWNDRRKLVYNPQVTVRERGVMEKCTYCVQRIRQTGIKATIEKREIRPNEVVTACMQACPTRAIQFGSLLHANTKMVEWRSQPRVYSVLNGQGTRPRTQYLAKIINEKRGLE